MVPFWDALFPPNSFLASKRRLWLLRLGEVHCKDQPRRVINGQMHAQRHLCASTRVLPRSKIGDNAIHALFRCPFSFTRMHVLAVATICSITHRAAHAQQAYRWQPDSAACAGLALSYASHRRTIIQHLHRIGLGATPSPPMFSTQ